MITIKEIDKRKAQMKEIIEEYQCIPNGIDLDKVVTECYRIANGLCPKCGAAEKECEEMLHEKHICKRWRPQGWVNPWSKTNIKLIDTCTSNLLMKNNICVSESARQVQEEAFEAGADAMLDAI